MSETHHAVRKQFAKTAQAYVGSAIHAKGEDLQTLLELLGDIRGKKALDIATGGATPP